MFEKQLTADEEAFLIDTLVERIAFDDWCESMELVYANTENLV